MHILDLMYVMARRAFYHWALREIDPLHPDVPSLLVRQSEFDERARELFKREATGRR